MLNLDEIRNNPLNYVAYYDERKNRIVSVPRSTHPMRHVLLTLAYSILAIVIAGGVRIGLHETFDAITSGGYPWWATFLENLASAITLVYLFVNLAPRFGMFPGIRGYKIELNEDNALDQKLASLVKKHPRQLNVDWFRDWAEGSENERKEMYRTMSAMLNKVQSSNNSKEFGTA